MLDNTPNDPPSPQAPDSPKALSPSVLSEACAAACQCAEAAKNLHLLCFGLGHPIETEAQWGAEQATHVLATLRRAAGPVAQVAEKLAATPIGEPVSFAGFFESSYHATALELGFRLLNNALLAAGCEPVFPRECRPGFHATFLALHRLYPSALGAVSQLQASIQQHWESVRKDLTENFPTFNSRLLIGLIQKEAAQAQMAKKVPNLPDEGPHDDSPVVLRGPGECPTVRTVEKRPLTLAQYDVVKALLDAGERGLGKDELDRKSGHGDARKVLKRLAESDSDWEAVIHFPGRSGGGYRIGFPLSMSGQRLIPAREQLAAIVEMTARFLDYLQDAVLIEGVKTPPVPQSTIAYKKGQAVYEWAAWEQAINPTSVSFEGPPIGMAAGGWPDWKALQFALVDLQALRKQLITYWRLAPIVGAKSVRLRVEATGERDGGEKGLFIHAEKGIPGHMHIEMPLDWPPPVPLDWWEQCRHALQRIKNVVKAEGTTSTHRMETHEETGKAQLEKASCSLEELLPRLPLRAIVAVAARSARRVQSLIQFPDEERKRQQHQHAVVAALEAAEAFCLDRALDAMWSPGDEAGRPKVVADANAAYSAAKSDAAGRAASSAFQTVMAAWEANRGNADSVMERGVRAVAFAFDAAETTPTTTTEKREARSIVVSAVNRDIQKLLGLDGGRFPQLGDPVDPSEKGSLGRL